MFWILFALVWELFFTGLIFVNFYCCFCFLRPQPRHHHCIRQKGTRLFHDETIRSCSWSWLVSPVRCSTLPVLRDFLSGAFPRGEVTWPGLGDLDRAVKEAGKGIVIGPGYDCHLWFNARVDIIGGLTGLLSNIFSNSFITLVVNLGIICN